ncbi:hypothetical protein BDW74DRAFT_136306 [Aspergillus multicolor]|uniref:uncharacterized protein n=1 Tax=Aspergillus multicolor TaxID=41759 RepID=UPI003CCE2F75
MPRPRHNTTSLPRGLRQELGIRDRFGEKKNKLNEKARKDLRREERAGNKRGGPGSKKNAGGRGRDYDDDDEDDFDEGDFEGDLGESDEDEGDVMAKLKAAKLKKEKPSASSKKAKGADAQEEKAADAPRKKVSKAVQDKLEQDDAEIAALEKRLGLKKGKVPKSFAEDGLDDLLGDLEEGSADENKKRKREADDWLQKKRRKAQGLPADESEESDSEEMSDEDVEDFDDDEDMDGFDEDDDEEDESEEEQPAPRKKENPYVAPVAATEDKPGKYIPPSLRAASNSESESLTRLRRQAQGHLNKMSEANLISILAEFEKLYREYPRQNVTSTLLNLLFALICERSALSDTFIILHAGFIAAVYKVMGSDFGAEIVQKIVETFDAGGDERGKFEGKEMINLMSLLSQLYNFHVIGSTLVFDYIRLFLQDINEDNTELLLKVIRNSGPQLRQDDPSSLKDIVLLIQPAVAKAGEASLSVRTKFMIDTITDLKNNRLKSAANSSIASEHITKMRKILGSLNNSRAIRASEPISISRSDIHNSSKKGKWWLVGASWKEDPLEAARQELSSAHHSASNQHNMVVDDDSDAEPDYASIAKAHRMNTDVRRSIFVAIMSANDYQDAHVRLLKLRLKRAQEFEIPRVLTHCAMEEDAHNPYYTLIARRLCGELGRRIKVSFMFTLWNIFKRMGESGDLEDEEDEDSGAHGEDEENPLSVKAIVNLAKLYASLIADGTLTLGILKTLNFAYLQPKTKTFIELLMISIIQMSQKQKKKKSKSKGEKEPALNEQPLVEIFMKTRDTPQIAKGCIYFLKKVVAKTDIVASEKEAVMVKWGVRVAVDALKVVASEEDKF